MDRTIWGDSEVYTTKLAQRNVGDSQNGRCRTVRCVRPCALGIGFTSNDCRSPTTSGRSPNASKLRKRLHIALGAWKGSSTSSIFNSITFAPVITRTFPRTWSKYPSSSPEFLATAGILCHRISQSLANFYRLKVGRCIKSA
jgi:hypothetical protein